MRRRPDVFFRISVRLYTLLPTLKPFDLPTDALPKRHIDPEVQAFVLTISASLTLANSP